jgi:hypothetical protein
MHLLPARPALPAVVAACLVATSLAATRDARA